MKRRFALLASVTTLPLLLTGCKELDDFFAAQREWQARVDRLTADAERLQEQLDKAQATAKEISANAVKALDNFDPVAVKEIFRGYQTMEKQNADLKRLLASAPRNQLGDVSLRDRRLKVMIQRYSGSFLFNGFVKRPDGEPLHFWANATYNSARPGIVFPNHAYNWLHEAWGDGNTDWFGKTVQRDNGAAIHQRYQDDANAQMARILDSSVYTTPQTQDEHYLEERLGGSGTYEFSFDAKPLSPVWSVTVAIATVEQDGSSSHVIHSVEMSNVASKPETFPVNVRYDPPV